MFRRDIPRAERLRPTENLAKLGSITLDVRGLVYSRLILDTDGRNHTANK